MEPLSASVTGSTGTLDTATLQALVDASADGLAVLDEQGRILVLNDAGACMLDASTGTIQGQLTPFDIRRHTSHNGADGLRRTTWPAPNGRRCELEYRITPLAGGRKAIWFRDVTEGERRQERLTAITRAASSVAETSSLRATLDAVATEILGTVNIAAVQILTVDDPQDELRILGMAGFGDAPDFVERLSACRRLGARVRFVEAFQQGEPVVVFGRKPVIMADPAWAPLHEIMGRPDWDSFVAMPLIARGQVLGVINAYYTRGEDPGPSSLSFLEAMAAQAAVAIDTSALLARTRSLAQSDERRRLARDLHDSAVQRTFSMRMQAKALRAELDRKGADLAQVQSRAQSVADLAQSALVDLRGLVFELRPLDLADPGLIEAIRTHADGVQEQTGLDITVHAPTDTEPSVDIAIQEDLYRIVQEALHNVVKHAHATEAGVWVSAPGASGDRLEIEIADNGRHRRSNTENTDDRLQHDRFGLVSMRERIQRWGGNLTAGPGSTGGWKVGVTLPMLGTHRSEAVHEQNR